MEAKRRLDLRSVQLTEHDGYFYGRGRYDIKDGGAILVATLLRLQPRVRPRRDLILALTAGEEGGAYNGVEWLIRSIAT